MEALLAVALRHDTDNDQNGDAQRKEEKSTNSDSEHDRWQHHPLFATPSLGADSWET
jgi:hypothetical protein